MKIKTHEINDARIAEITSDPLLIKTLEDGLGLLGNIYYQGFDKMIIHEQSITPDFFDLKNGIAGEILQKFSNYRMPLAIVGDFTQYESKSIKDFIRESNQHKQVIFVRSVDEAIRVFSGK
ncbi:MAG: DUF4180 domain-containing protein [Proteiniphilum sp.]|nr:DUF4180 domain-containing protein [Proteiniphilum sp.]NCB23981.1 DUF4180 domain-containing protein [Bacteroidia bacterium]MDD2938384.1 DUF4180 domain-containing protein [Proteiniphilum sp.]MDD3075701.1 DUF4180 domain-containing protein [Proteiniphilum sp.]MDD3955447.1 DUF4180 domain-containing protein [Proteiniphilum sp.]